MGKSKVICPICNKEFERATAKKKYCGTECQRLANIKHTREKQKMRHPGKIGRPVKKREKAVKKMRRHESELAWILMCPYDTAGEPEEIMPCVRDGAGPDFTPPSRCLQCTVEWFKEKE